MQGKAVVITGGTSGIGEVAADALAKMGAHIILAARNTSRGNATLARLRRSAPGVQHSVYFADLTRLAEMKRVAAEIADKEPPIDVLINNAGALFAKRRVTEDGLECTFALNHMAYFAVTEGLRARLVASGAAHGLRSTRACNSGFCRPSIGKELRSGENLWPIETLQYSVHARTCSPPARHWGDCELFTSRFCLHSVR
jgi:NAD(P)-dependent dehydrogenase (short-subunit alcohol dehydrogenase family)